MNNYQDIWKKGKLVEAGERDCESRYQEIRELAKLYKRPFTVLDIGANCGYFSIRLAEEFPHCTCVAVEPTYFKLEDVSHLDNLVVLTKPLNLKSLTNLGRSERFDIVLCLSAIHYLDPVASYRTILDSLVQLGTHLVLELPVESRTLSNRFDEMHKLITALGVPKKYIQSHVNSRERRPLYILDGVFQPDRISRIDKEFPCSPVFSISKEQFSIAFPNKGEEERVYFPGINLNTYLVLGGVYPSRQDIAKLVQDADWVGHHDIREWNVILNGNKIALIDRCDPGHPDEAPQEDVGLLVARVLKGR